MKDTIKFITLDIPVRSEALYDTGRKESNILSTAVLGQPFFYGIRKPQLILSSLHTRFIIKIILVNICTTENKRTLNKPLGFLCYKL